MTRLPDHLVRDAALCSVFSAIEAGGHRAYLVGGAVRNALLGQAVDDMDIATDARPDRVTELARAAGLKVVPTGIDHGTVTVVAKHRGFEVTTFRRDVETDGRHAVVAFSDDLAEDARRRDFTMNALYADQSGTVIDTVGGLRDLRAGHLRFVGQPRQRIHEDYLRILRFFRFLAWYGRDCDPDAVAACSQLRDGLDRIARERVGTEMRKLLSAPNPFPAIELMQDTGVLHKIMPDADTSWLQRLRDAERRTGIAPSWQRRLAALVATSNAEPDLRLSRNETKTLKNLVLALNERWSLDRAGFCLGASAGTDIAVLRSALHGLQLSPVWQSDLEAAAAARLPIAAADLANDLQGPALGAGLRAAQDAWIDSGFVLPVRSLLDVARQAGRNET
ncbi:CCA tRNA nucleotidyltransferase [Paracoccus sp. Z330]|uniref:CCA tRNA nucleotidyltransferase n=1 Tax=Paracoccus onchidii TaxID=3017813 RepID=A0ABT4ZBY9_9RHOB|nr:CCA tRNA nucleotidyltransferase [Paracoccus onchidii]MDB6176809.1 CCA tRNA nucleotidyltransferase [Paracoccus onchidii]